MRIIYFLNKNKQNFVHKEYDFVLKKNLRQLKYTI